MTSRGLIQRMRLRGCCLRWRVTGSRAKPCCRRRRLFNRHPGADAAKRLRNCSMRCGLYSFTMISTKDLKIRAKKHMKAFKRFVSNTFRSFTPVDIQRTLGGLGIARGDTVLVHSSFDAFEGFQGKPTDVISVLQSVVGGEGVVMMP